MYNRSIRTNKDALCVHVITLFNQFTDNVTRRAHYARLTHTRKCYVIKLFAYRSMLIDYVKIVSWWNK